MDQTGDWRFEKILNEVRAELRRGEETSL